MSLCPGLVGDVVPSAMFRTFLGAPPQLAVEKRLLRHMTSYTPVGSWFVSRRRVREQANEFIELDGSTIDPEIMLRHCHIFFVRRQLFNEVLEKQVSLLEAGKPPKEAEPEILACLNEMNEGLASRVLYEKKRLEFAKVSSTLPHRRELQPNEPLDRWDTLCMLRCLEHDVISQEYTSPLLLSGNMQQQQQLPQFSREFVASCEAQAKAFLPLNSVVDSAEKLAQLFGRIGASVAADAAQIPSQELASKKSPLLSDKKDERLVLKTFIPGDYQKTGCMIPRLRPTDATSYFRFFGERVMVPSIANNNSVKDPLFNFRRAMWGNVFRRYATNSSFLANSMSQYWGMIPQPGSACVHPNPPLSRMPFEIADIVCRQQVDICLATKLRAQFMYCHQDHSKQLWRTELTVPSLRMLSATGAQCAEDMLSSVLVDAFFHELEGRQVVVQQKQEQQQQATEQKEQEGSTSTGEKSSSKKGKKNQKASASSSGDDSASSSAAAASVKMLTSVNSNFVVGGDSIALLSDEKMRAVVSFVNEMVALRGSSLDTLLQRAQGSLKNVLCPVISDAEADWQAPSLDKASTIHEIKSDEESEENIDENLLGLMMEEDGALEEASVKIPNEELTKK